MFKNAAEVRNGSGQEKVFCTLTRLPTNCKELYWQRPQTVNCTGEGQKHASIKNLKDHVKDNGTSKSLETSHNLLSLTPEHSPVHGSTGDLEAQKNRTHPCDCVTKFKMGGTSKTMGRRRPNITPPPPLCFLPSIGRIT